MARSRTTTERGYGAAHQRMRATWERALRDEGPVMCHRNDETGCGTIIHHGDRWDLGHTDDRTAWTGPECIPCNRGAGGRNGARTTNARRGMTIREW